jgi:hypothetical protein
MFDLIAMLGKEALASAAASPGMELGKQMMAGNIGGGLEGFAKSQIGPQMDFVKSLGNPDANSFDAFMKMQKEKQSRPVGMPQIAELSQGPIGPQGMQTQMRGIPMAQGLPPGLLAQLGYQR